MNKTISWENVNMLGYIAQIFARNSFMTLLNYMPSNCWDPSVDSKEAVFHLQTTATLQDRRKEWDRQKQKIKRNTKMVKMCYSINSYYCYIKSL